MAKTRVISGTRIAVIPTTGEFVRVIYRRPDMCSLQHIFEQPHGDQDGHGFEDVDSCRLSYSTGKLRHSPTVEAGLSVSLSWGRSMVKAYAFPSRPTPPRTAQGSLFSFPQPYENSVATPGLRSSVRRWDQLPP